MRVLSLAQQALSAPLSSKSCSVRGIRCSDSPVRMLPLRHSPLPEPRCTTGRWTI